MIARRRDHGQHLACRQQELRAAVGQHEPNARRRRLGINRQIGRPRFQHGKYRHNHLERARKRNRHDRLGTSPQTDQMTRKLVGPRVKLTIAQRLIPKHNRNRARRARSLRSKQLRQRRLGNFMTRRVEGANDLVFFRRA